MPREPERLSGDQRADVAIIGGGFTGLWTALFLKELEPALSVAVVEQGLVGYGASGRNAGIVGETVDHSHELAARHFGESEARELARLGRENLEELEAYLRLRGIDAELERAGQLIMALTPAHVEALRRSVDFAHRLGLSDWRFLTAAEAREQIHSPLYLGAAFAPRSGTLHPVKLIEGLRSEAVRLGVRIFEGTPVTGLSFEGGGVAVRAHGGRVKAEKAVLAANAYSHRLRRSLLKRFLPLYDYILVSEPLTPAQRSSIGWKGRQGATDARTFFNYYRLTADDRILWGTSEAVYFRGNRVDRSCDHSPPHYEALRRELPATFPRASRPRVSLRLGRADLLDHAAHALFRVGRARAALLWPRLHGPWHRQHADCREGPVAHGSGAPEPPARSGSGAPEALPLPSRAAAAHRRRRRDPPAAACG